MTFRCAATLVVLLALGLTPSRACFDEAATRPAGSVLRFPDADKITIKLQQADGLLLTNDVKLNGVNVGWFIVDTGADGITLDKDLVSIQALPFMPDDALRKWNWRRLDVLSVSGVRIETLPVNLISLKPVTRSIGVRVAGVLGGNFFASMPVTIDYETLTLTMHRPATFCPPAGTDSVKFTTRHPDLFDKGIPDDLPTFGAPIIPGAINGIACDLQPDTGGTSMMTIDARFAAAHSSLIDRNGRASFSSRSIQSQSDYWPAKLDSLTALGSSFVPTADDTPVIGHRAPDSSANVNIAAVIGEPILRQFVLTFDYATGQLWYRRFNALTFHDRLAAGFDVKAVDLNGNTLLLQALKHGTPADVAAVLDAGADPHASSAFGLTALIHAVWRGPEMVKLFLEKTHNADLNVPTLKGRTPLLAAAAAGDEQSVRLLLAAGADCNAKNKDGSGFLHDAAAGGNVAVLKIALEKGCKLEDATATVSTPLGAAAFANSLATFDALLAAGADPTVRFKGNTLFHAAVSQNVFGDFIERLGSIDRLKALINERTDSDGGTALAIAAFQRRSTAVRALIKLGADVDLAAADGSTPLDFAAASDNVESINDLLDAGAKIEARGFDGNTAVSNAALSSSERAVAALIARGADVNTARPDGVTPLHVAAERGSYIGVRALIAAHANVYAVDKTGRTPLHHAAAANRYGNCAVLLAAGADPLAKDAAGRTPASIAAAYRNNLTVLFAKYRDERRQR